MRVGFVGLGRMGLPMARNLLGAGHELVVHSRETQAVAELVRGGARSANSPREVASSVDVFCSCRVSPEQSLEVFLGGEGAIAAGRAGLLCIDFATIDPATSRRIGAGLAEHGIGFLDAPVSGGPGGAASASTDGREAATTAAPGDL